jgi:hypothetical protein
MRATDWLIEMAGRFFFHVGAALRLVSVSDDVETAVSDRSRFLWKEAERRGYQMEQLMVAGKPTDTFRVRHQNKTYFFKSLPLPVMARALRMDDKVFFKSVMAGAGLSVPRSYSASSAADAKEALTELSVVCIKPRTGSNGRHTYPFVRTPKEAEQAFKSVRRISPFASVEEHLEGNLCRATCVDGRLVGFLESEHPYVEGDGTSTIRELIDAANAR